MPMKHGKPFDHNTIWFKQIRPDVITAEHFRKKTLVYTTNELDQLLVDKADKTGPINEEYISLLSQSEGNLVSSEIKISDIMMGEVADGGTF